MIIGLFQTTAHPPEADATRVDLLKQIDVVIVQQQAATSANEDHDAKVAALKSTLTRLADGTIDEEPPYMILLQDSLKESIRNSETKLKSFESSVVSARSAAESAKQTGEDLHVQSLRPIEFRLVPPDRKGEESRSEAA